jgi:hypothetical protein
LIAAGRWLGPKKKARPQKCTFELSWILERNLVKILIMLSSSASVGKPSLLYCAVNVIFSVHHDVENDENALKQMCTDTICLLVLTMARNI